MLALYVKQIGGVSATPHPHYPCRYFNILLDGLQGLLVSVAFCYRNGEVRERASERAS